MKSRIVKLLLVYIIGLTALMGQDRNQNPIELGMVIWLRDYDQAIQKSRETGKPIFLLFQEVPGCANCTKYGRDILSHPHMAEVIESHFIPLAIYNNKSGKDREVLLQFGEPSWNNPVVRIINQEGQDMVKRIGDFRSKSLILSQVMKVLKSTHVEVPKYLELLHQEWHAEENSTSIDYLGMYCFWTGEKEIAQIEGVIATEAGYMDGREVVKVTYNDHKASIKSISENAKSHLQ